MRAITLITCDEPFDERWERVPGVLSAGNDGITIDPAQYFYVYDSPTWRIVDWELLMSRRGDLREDAQTTLEQKCMDFIDRNARTTRDPALVLYTSRRVYEHLFSSTMLADEVVELSEPQRQAVIEVATLMALNQVSREGDLGNVGPAWFFGDVLQQVFDIAPDEAARIDDVYHGTLFNEVRRQESVVAHVALGGRLIHACQSSADMAGGVVAPYGVDAGAVSRNLSEVKPEWIASIHS